MKVSNIIKALVAVCVGFFLISSLVIAAAKNNTSSNSNSNSPALTTEKSNTEMKAKATKTSKPTVVVVYSHSCPMCNEFENRVLNNPEVKEALNKFTLKKENASSSKNKVEVTPTVIIFDKSKREIKKFVPSLEKAKFIEILRQVD